MAHVDQSRGTRVALGTCKPCDARALDIWKAPPFRLSHGGHILSPGALRWRQLRRIWGICVSWGLQLSVIAPWLRTFGQDQTPWPNPAGFPYTVQWWHSGGLRAASRRKASTCGSMVGPSVEHGNGAVTSTRFHRQYPLGLLQAVANCSGPHETDGGELRLPTNSNVSRSGGVHTAWGGVLIVVLSGSSYPTPRLTQRVLRPQRYHPRITHHM